ncbi:MAG TPA: Lrp/AsnC family transcriptional regulator [Mycobacteriales bacterium]|jgi:DNA-binding Lrp family transcriptional regulator|nr:Lrp/AsnC family transcriptional regulator [Mycobacteriales bacterium]HVX70955.1 Lrp/AsnC family transcriptional regulator [Mycobacteriales bacterium]
MSSIDGLDGRIIALFATEPRIGVLEASRRLGVARGTVQARLDRLERDGVITSWAPSVDSGALGFPVSAFATLEIAQGHGHDGVAAHLRTIPEVLEAHTITGEADMMLRLVARSNSDLQRVIDQVVTSPDVTRASTVIVLSSEVPMRMLPLVEVATSEA